MSTPRKGTITRKVYELVKERRRVTTREVRNSISANNNTIRGSLIRLANLGLIERVDKGEYEYR